MDYTIEPYRGDYYSWFLKHSACSSPDPLRFLSITFCFRVFQYSSFSTLTPSTPTAVNRPNALQQQIYPFYLESAIACPLSGSSGLVLLLGLLGLNGGLLTASRSDDLSTLVLKGLVIGVLSPLRGLGPLGVLPGTSIRVLAATLALADTAKLLRQVLGVDLLQQLALVVAAKDVDLLDGDGVEPALDYTPDGGESPGSVDHVQLTQTLRVVVLGYGGGLTDVGVDGGDLGDGDTLEIHNGAAGLEEAASLAGTGGQTGVGDQFVLDSEVLQHALGGGDLVHGCQVDATKGLDVDGAAILCTC